MSMDSTFAVFACVHTRMEVGSSFERLMTFLTALGYDVEIVIRNKPRSAPVCPYQSCCDVNELI